MSRTGWLAALLALASVAACAEPAPEPKPEQAGVKDNTIAASVAAKYPRAVTRTPLGDPVTLDVCALAVSAPVQTVKLEPDPVARAAGCDLTVRTTRDRGDLSVTLGPDGRPGLRTHLRPPSVRAPGVNLYAYDFDRTNARCVRTIQLYQTGTRTVWTTVAGTPAVAADVPLACDVATKVRGRVNSVASTRPTLARLPRLNLPARSLLRLDTCKVAAAGKVGATIEATAAGVANSYGAGCRFAGEGGSVDLVAGTLRDGEALPGSDRVVARRSVWLQPSDAPSCAVAAQVGASEIMTSRFTGTGSSAPADCAPAARALVAYLDALDG